MTSLTDLVSSRMTPEVVRKLVGLTGIRATDAKRARDAIGPTQCDGRWNRFFLSSSGR